MKDFQKYSNENIQMFSSFIPKMLRNCFDTKKVLNLIDLGCGDGMLLLAIKNKYPEINLAGFDLSSERLERLNKIDPQISTFRGDVCDLFLLKNNKYDMVISSQVIEHVSNDTKMLSEINNLLNSGGYLYISSVVKKWYGWWIYKCNGKVRCDPTHVREYESKMSFENMLEKYGFKVEKSKITPFMPSSLNNFFRLLIRLKLISNERVQYIYFKHAKVMKVLNFFFRIPVPGYFIIECFCLKK
jgi:ubiquinone/menaquinone biosynthesis C-methylase UbiE